jgi:hypothetical protein
VRAFSIFEESLVAIPSLRPFGPIPANWPGRS